MNGLERAAILLLSLGENNAAKVLTHMDPKEVQKVGIAMSEISNISKEQVDHVVMDFLRTAEKHTPIGLGKDDYIRGMLVSALGESKATKVIDRILLGGNTKGLETLKWMDSRAVAELIRNEHPQIIAIVLAYLDNDQAGDVLGQLPDITRVDVIMRIASIDGIMPTALQELNGIMEKHFEGQSNIKSASVGGIKTAANILNSMDSSIEAEIMDNIKEVDTELGDKIQDLMFVFDNLSYVGDRGIQSLLREISSDSLILALKGSDDRLKEKFFSNMSKRAAEMLREDLEAKGPVRLREVEDAQKEILTIARHMAEAGDISLGGNGSEEYV